MAEEAKKKSWLGKLFKKRDPNALRKKHQAKVKAKQYKKIQKAELKGAKITHTAGKLSGKPADLERATKELSPHGKVRKGAKSVHVTKGGAYAAYGKKTKAAKSFRSSFSEASKAGKKTFMWDGRSYSTKKKAAPSKKTVSPKKAAPKKSTKEKILTGDKSVSVLDIIKKGKKKKPQSKKTPMKKIGIGQFKSSITKSAKGGVVGDSVKTYSSGGYVEGK